MIPKRVLVCCLILKCFIVLPDTEMCFIVFPDTEMCFSALPDTEMCFSVLRDTEMCSSVLFLAGGSDKLQSSSTSMNEHSYTSGVLQNLFQ